MLYMISFNTEHAYQGARYLYTNSFTTAQMTAQALYAVYGAENVTIWHGEKQVG